MRVLICCAFVVPIRWFPSGSNPAQYKHVVTCGPPPSSDAEDFCHPENLPCLFNGSAASLSVRLLQKPNLKLVGVLSRLTDAAARAVVKDPCEYHDLSKTMPAMLQQLVTRLGDYQATAVPKGFHQLKPTGPCGSPDVASNPSWNGTCE